MDDGFCNMVFDSLLVLYSPSLIRPQACALLKDSPMAESPIALSNITTEPYSTLARRDVRLSSPLYNAKAFSDVRLWLGLVATVV